MDSLFVNNNYRVYSLLIKYPSKSFSAREIARELGLSHSTVLKCLDNLFKFGFIKKDEKTLYVTYNLNTDKGLLYRKNWVLFEIFDSGVVEYIQNKMFPSSIVLYGSCANGYFNDKSDIDLFVEASEVQLNLKKYEQKLGRKIHVLFEPNINDLSKELRNNIVNYTVLYGFLKVS